MDRDEDRLFIEEQFWPKIKATIFTKELPTTSSCGRHKQRAKKSTRASSVNANLSHGRKSLIGLWKRRIKLARKPVNSRTWTAFIQLRKRKKSGIKFSASLDRSVEEVETGEVHAKLKTQKVAELDLEGVGGSSTDVAQFESKTRKVAKLDLQGMRGSSNGSLDHQKSVDGKTPRLKTKGSAAVVGRTLSQPGSVSLKNAALAPSCGFEIDFEPSTKRKHIEVVECTLPKYERRRKKFRTSPFEDKQFIKIERNSTSGRGEPRVIGMESGCLPSSVSLDEMSDLQSRHGKESTLQPRTPPVRVGTRTKPERRKGDWDKVDEGGHGDDIDGIFDVLGL